MIPFVISVASLGSEGILIPKLRRVAISHVDKDTRFFAGVWLMLARCSQTDDTTDRTGQTSAI